MCTRASKKKRGDDANREARAAWTASAKAKGKAKARPKARPRAGPRLDKVTFTREEAKTFLPGVVGCNIKKDEVLHMRWQVRYPNPMAPFSTSSVWNDEITERAALFHCLTWAWRCHTEQTHEVCPFDFAA